MLRSGAVRSAGGGLRSGLVLAMLLVSTLAGLDRAEADDRKAEADALVAEGIALGEKGQFGAAIGKFLQADERYPRAIHSCNIGLAYRHWKRLPQAHLFLQRCRVLATAKLPRWVDKEVRSVSRKLRKGSYAALTIHASPAGTTVRLPTLVDRRARFSTPLRIWAATGTQHELVLELAGHKTLRHVVDVADRAERRLDLALEPVSLLTVERRDPELRERPRPAVLITTELPPRASTWPGWLSVGLGVAAAGVGGVLHGLASSRADRIRDMVEGADADSELSTFEIERGLALGMYAVGAAAIGVGSWLLAR